MSEFMLDARQHELHETRHAVSDALADQGYGRTTSMPWSRS